MIHETKPLVRKLCVAVLVVSMFLCPLAHGGFVRISSAAVVLLGDGIRNTIRMIDFRTDIRSLKNNLMGVFTVLESQANMP